MIVTVTTALAAHHKVHAHHITQKHFIHDLTFTSDDCLTVHMGFQHFTFVITASVFFERVPQDFSATQVAVIHVISGVSPDIIPLRHKTRSPVDEVMLSR